VKNFYLITATFLIIFNTYSNEEFAPVIDCQNSKLTFNGKEIPPSQVVKFPPKGINIPFERTWDTSSNSYKERTACESYPRLADYTNCIVAKINPTKKFIKSVEICADETSLEKSKKLKDKCNLIFKGVGVQDRPREIERMEREISNVSGVLQAILSYNGIDVDKGDLKLSGCQIDNNPEENPINGSDIFGRQTSYKGRHHYLSCPLSQNLPWEGDDKKYCELLLKEIGLGQDSTMQYMIEDLYNLKKKEDEEIKKEYATKLRTLAISEMMEKYAREFGDQIDYPGDLADPNNICYKSSIQKKYQAISRKTPKSATTIDDIIQSCQKINAQLVGNPPHCVGSYCGVKMEYLEKFSYYKSDVEARKTAIKSEISKNPMMSSLFDGDNFDSGAFPRINDCQKKDDQSIQLAKEMQAKYKDNLNQALKLLCSTEDYPDSLLYKDKRLTDKLGKYTRYGELQKCIEEEMQDNSDTVGTISAVLGGSALLVGVFFPPAGIALGLASTAISVTDATLSVDQNSTMNVVSSGMGDVEGIAENNTESSSKVTGAVLDVGATAVGLKGVKAGAGSLVKGGGKVIDVANKTGQVRQTFNSTYTIVTDIMGRPVDEEFYDLPRDQKVSAFSGLPLKKRRYVDGFGETRTKTDLIIQQEFFTPVTKKLSDLESAVLATLISSLDGTKKEATISFIREGIEADNLTLEKMQSWCKSHNVACPKSNRALKKFTID